MRIQNLLVLVTVAAVAITSPASAAKRTTTTTARARFETVAFRTVCGLAVATAGLFVVNVADQFNAFGHPHEHTVAVADKSTHRRPKAAIYYQVKSQDPQTGKVYDWRAGKSDYDKLEPGRAYRFIVHDRLLDRDQVLAVEAVPAR